MAHGDTSEGLGDDPTVAPGDHSFDPDGSLRLFVFNPDAPVFQPGEALQAEGGTGTDVDIEAHAAELDARPIPLLDVRFTDMHSEDFAGLPGHLEGTVCSARPTADNRLSISGTNAGCARQSDALDRSCPGQAYARVLAWQRLSVETHQTWMFICAQRRRHGGTEPGRGLQSAVHHREGLHRHQYCLYRRSLGSAV